MSHPYARARRIADLIRRELSKVLQQEIDDQKLATLTISKVELSRDYAYARVYISLFSDGCNVREVMASLNGAASYYRHILASTVNLRSTPQLRFLYDDSNAKRQRIEEIIDHEKAQANYIVDEVDEE